MFANRLLLGLGVLGAIVTPLALLGSWRSDPPDVRRFSLLLSLGVVAAMAIILWRRSRAPEASSETSERLPSYRCAAVTDSGLELERADGSRESLAWDAIEGIDVCTTSEGPWNEDVYLVLMLDRSDTSVRAIPQSSEGFSDLVTHVCAIPGFNEKEFIRAMGCTSDRRFECWRRALAV